MTYSQTDIITSKQLLAFLAAKHKGTVCAKCGVNALEPLVETEGSPNVAHVHLPIKGMGYLAAAAMVCRNCGDISQYWWDAIQDWIELNKIGPDG